MSMTFGSFPPMHPLCFPDSFGMPPRNPGRQRGNPGRHPEANPVPIRIQREDILTKRSIHASFSGIKSDFPEETAVRHGIFKSPSQR
jgi:hypothetical protein